MLSLTNKNEMEDFMQNIENAVNKIVDKPFTTINVEVSANSEISAESIEQAESVIERMCAAHDGKHKLNITVKL